MSQPILSIKKVEKAFSGNLVLKGIDFDLYPGEIMGLVGENGAGKSTLMKMITGVYSCDAGEIIYNGKPVVFTSTKESLASGIAIIHQEFNLFQNLSVAENIFLDKREFQSSFGIVKWKEMNQAAEKVLAELDADIDVTTLVQNLGVREQQLVEIAKAISTNARIIIMDEPSAALPENEVQKLFDVTKLLKQKGVAIIYVSHRMNEIAQICDRVTVLRDGVNQGILNVQETALQEIINRMVGREIDDYYPQGKREPKEVMFTVKNLNSGFLRNIDLTISKSEIVCLYGLAGSGTTELAECLFGLSALDSGEITIDGATLSKHTPRDAIKSGMSYVPPDRRRQGIVKELSIEKNTILSTARKNSTAGFFNQKKTGELVQGYVTKLNIRAVNIQQAVGKLSGGNQQKVVLSRWLEVKPKVLILNEPTRGVDIGAKTEIYSLIDLLARSGMAILFISSEVPEVIGMADRVIVMNKGEMVAQYANEGLTQEKLLSAASRQKEGGIQHAYS